MARGQNEANHPNRKVHRDRYTDYTDPQNRPDPDEMMGDDDDYEPDYEAIMESHRERNRPGWAD